MKKAKLILLIILMATLGYFIKAPDLAAQSTTPSSRYMGGPMELVTAPNGMGSRSADQLVRQIQAGEGTAGCTSFT
jgi:hypothetical protein